MEMKKVAVTGRKLHQQRLENLFKPTRQCKATRQSKEKEG
jgi:hypothetical protein